MQSSLNCKQSGDRKHHFTTSSELQLPVSIQKIIPTCYHRNKGEVENIYIYQRNSAIQLTSVGLTHARPN